LEAGLEGEQRRVGRGGVEQLNGNGKLEIGNWNRCSPLMKCDKMNRTRNRNRTEIMPAFKAKRGDGDGQRSISNILSELCGN